MRPSKTALQNVYLAGLHLCLMAIASCPLIAVPAFSGEGRVTAKLALVLWTVSIAAGILGILACGLALRRMDKRRPLKMASIALPVFYLVLFLLADWVVGMAIPIPASGRLDVPKAELYGWALEPNQKLNIIDPDTNEVFTETVNASGWRDVDHTPAKTKPRVLILGDSQVFGHGVALQNTMSRQLQNILGDSVEVLSMGLGGYGTDQEYLVLLNEGLDWQPDQVVLVFTTGNDVMDNMHEISFFGTAPKPSFELIDGELKQRPFVGRRPGLLRRLFGHSNICRLIRLRQQAGNVTANPQGVRVLEGQTDAKVLLDDPDSMEDFDNDYSGYAIFKPRADWSPKLSHGWELTLAILRAMNDACAAHDATFSIYANFQFPDDFIMNIERNGETITLDAQGPTRMLREFAQEEGIPFVEESDEMMKGNASGSWSFEKDGHYSPLGNQMAARAIAKHLSSLDSATFTANNEP